MFGVHEIFVLISEVVLSAYPSLIKLTDAGLIYQVGLRMFVFAGMAAVAGFITGNPLSPAVFFTKETIATGLLNLLHVGTSYIGFDQLAGGNAMALFYTYPVWNIIGAALAFGEKIQLSALPWIGVALAGAIALAQPTRQSWTAIGVIAALLAALTETGIYLWFRSHGESEGKDKDEPWTKMTQMYGSSGLIWLVGVLIAAAVGFITSSAFQTKSLSTILLFNALVGFGGYALRFYMIPKVSTVLFSALSFFGIISAYLLGWIFSGESPSLLQAAGAAAIIAANAVLVTKDTA